MDRLSRRDFIRTSAGTMVALPLLLEACGGTSPAATGASSGGSSTTAFKYPTYVPFQGPKPDYPPSSDGLIPPAYASYPKDLIKTVKSVPGKGGEMTSYTQTVTAMPPPMDQNATWQEVNKQLGIKLNMVIAGNAIDYQAKLATLIAGNDLPDTFWSSIYPIPNLPQFLAAQCADLTPYLSGDAVKDFANLAAFPPYVWKGPLTVFNGRIFGVPIPRSLFGSTLMVHYEILEKIGAAAPKTADEFKAMLKELTRPQASQWGLGANVNSQMHVPTLFLQILGGPNNWREAGGKLTKDFETDEFKAALGFARELWSGGLFHPDSTTATNVQMDTNFAAGKAVMYYSTWFGFQSFYWGQALRLNPGVKMGAIPPFSADGKAKPVYLLGSEGRSAGNFGVTYLKKASAERIKEILGVLNFLAAPFGSEESLLLSFGLKDADFNFDAKGNPIATQKGFANSPVPWRFIADKSVAQYNAANSEEYAKVVHSAEEAMNAVAVADPTLSLYSETNAGQGAVLRQAATDTINGIVTGRQQLAEWDQFLKDWRSKGGDKIRAEYEQALAAGK